MSSSDDGKEKKTNTYNRSDNSKKNNEEFSLKSYVLLLILFILVVSDIFQSLVLGNIQGATNLDKITFKGVICSGLVLIITHAILIGNL